MKQFKTEWMRKEAPYIIWKSPRLLWGVRDAVVFHTKGTMIFEGEAIQCPLKCGKKGPALHVWEKEDGIASMRGRCGGILCDLKELERSQTRKKRKD